MTLQTKNTNKILCVCLRTLRAKSRDTKSHMQLIVSIEVFQMAFLLAAAVCVFLLSSCISVNADTPANCTYEEIRGTWLFSIGEGGHDNTINCSEFKSVAELQVQLLFPDVAVDSEGNVGFWTLIYNQGFEVQINGKAYFAFSAYEKRGRKVVSYCDMTLNGWSHDSAEYKPGNWACYSGM